MSHCEAVRDELKAYVDGQLSPLSRLTMRWHLARCAACREEMMAMEQIGKQLRNGETNELEPALRAKILARVPEGAPEPLPETAAKSKRRKPVVMWGAAVAAAMVWFVVYPIANRVTGLSSGENVATKQIGMAAMTYAQDYDAQPYLSAGARPPLPSATTAPSQALLGESLGENLPDIKFSPPTASETRRLKSHLEAEASDRARPMMKQKIEALPSITTEGDERQVHKEADITLEVNRPEETSETVERMVKEIGGYVANNAVSTEAGGAKYASLTTKVPVEDFESFLSSLSKLGVVMAKSVNGEDITEKISDSAAAERTLREEARETEARLQTNRSRTQTRQDRETLRELRIRVAQTQARLKTLRKLATLATITVQLQEKPKPTPPPKQSGFLDEMRDAGQDAARSLAQAARLPVLGMIWLLAYSPILIALLFVYRYVART